MNITISDSEGRGRENIYRRPLHVEVGLSPDLEERMAALEQRIMERMARVDKRLGELHDRVEVERYMRTHPGRPSNPDEVLHKEERV